MYVEKLWIKNFRNYDEQVISLSGGLNVVVGKNASGKTNLLESLCVSSLGKSPRTSKDKDLIKWGESSARIKLLIKKEKGSETLELYIDEQGKKRVKNNEVAINNFGELLGILNVVYFSPDELKLIKESPEERRKFIDISLSQDSRPYFYGLIEYNKILAQRNKLLKTVFSESELKEMFTVLNRQLAEKMVYIRACRKNFLEKLSPLSDLVHKKIAGQESSMALLYETDTPDNTIHTVKMLEESFEKDFSLKYSTKGIHRDDIKITVDDIDLRKFGSQGQQRTAAIAMKMSEIERYKSENKEIPVLLLDDVLSELDKDRQTQLLDATAGIQTIISCTEYELKSPAKIFEIEKGKVKNEL